ncbi:lipopolysaccharide biosynthesis protein [Lachnospira multipara]|uniref:lipopolysaccharide biosynthesis protein n=1 Tax=Lachnospira multipara TaxID=28051 RepID=UPI0004201B87|nr:lipopolysaccharide biosynthesis protein [Lachnospira multipara]
MNEEVNMKKNIAWNTFGSIWYSACQWLITIIVYHIASYEAAGYLSLAMTTSSSFSAISLFSMRNFQVSDVKGEYSRHEYVGSRILTCLIAFIFCAVASIYGNSIYQMLCIDAFMLVRVAEALVDVLHGENQKHNRYDYIGKSYILRGALTVIIFSIGLKFSDDLLITLFIMAIANLAVAILYDWFKTNALDKIKPIIISNEVISLLKKCVPIVIFSFLLSLQNLIPKNILQQIMGTDQLGIYSTIASPTLVVQVFASVAFNPFLPAFSLAYMEEEYDKFLKMLRKTYLAFIGLGVIVTIGAMLLGRIGLTIILGKDILEYYNLFMPIVWVTILTAIIWILSAIIVAMRQMKWLLIGIIVDFILMLVLVKPCITTFGKNGVSIVQLISYGVYIVFMIVLCELTVSKKIKNKKWRM